MAKPRVRVVGTDPQTGVVDRAKTLALLENLEATLFEFGGRVLLTANREEVARVDDGSEQGAPVYETTEIVAQYDPYLPVAPPRTTEEPAAEPDEALEFEPAGA